MRLAMAAWLIGTCTAVAWTTNSVQVSLYCLSLRFEPASTLYRGQTYTANMSSLSQPPPNGELMPLSADAGWTHGGFYGWTDPQTQSPVTLALGLNVPSFVDANSNTFNDFFEVSQGVTNAQTVGAYSNPAQQVQSVKATWNRPAGSTKGTCRLDLPSLGLVFTHTFELIEYDGELRYTNFGNNIFGVVELRQVGHPESTLAGPVQLLRQGTDRLSIAPDSWTNQLGQAYPYDALEPIDRTGTNYLAAFTFADGDLATPDPDYLDWELILSDARDWNGDGVPDLTDPRPQVTLTLELHGRNPQLTLHGSVGQDCQIEESSDLIGEDWQPVQSLTMTNEVQAVELQPATNSTAFWRVRTP